VLYFAGMLIMAFNVWKTTAMGRAADAPIPSPSLPSDLPHSWKQAPQVPVAPVAPPAHA
jgi:hypothetical protein